jgi:hypothetical protein
MMRSGGGSEGLCDLIPEVLGMVPESIVRIQEKPLMNCAVRVPGMNAVFFLLDAPDNSEGIEIETGAWVEVPMNVNLWPEGGASTRDVALSVLGRPETL